MSNTDARSLTTYSARERGKIHANRVEKGYRNVDSRKHVTRTGRERKEPRLLQVAHFCQGMASHKQSRDGTLTERADGRAGRPAGKRASELKEEPCCASFACFSTPPTRTRLGPIFLPGKPTFLPRIGDEGSSAEAALSLSRNSSTSRSRMQRASAGLPDFSF